MSLIPGYENTFIKYDTRNYVFTDKKYLKLILGLNIIGAIKYKKFRDIIPLVGAVDAAVGSIVSEISKQCNNPPACNYFLSINMVFKEKRSGWRNQNEE